MIKKEELEVKTSIKTTKSFSSMELALIRQIRSTITASIAVSLACMVSVKFSINFICSCFHLYFNQEYFALVLFLGAMYGNGTYFAVDPRYSAQRYSNLISTDTNACTSPGCLLVITLKENKVFQFPLRRAPRVLISITVWLIIWTTQPCLWSSMMYRLTQNT